MSRRLRTQASALIALMGTLSLVGASCSQVPIMRGNIDALKKITEQAQRNGAIRCAPRELALAKSHLSFAEVELGQGDYLRAGKHLEIAEANAHAATDLSPPQKCAERGFVEEAPPPKPGDCDGDGLLDPDDAKCPCEAENYNGFEDADGCPDDPDTDGDGIADSLDSCVLEKEDVDGYLDADGCPDPDNDLDTVPDAKDKDADGKSCALDPEDPDGFQDEDGCPDPDNDGDGVLDVEDICPMEPGPAGGDRPGCPKKSLVIVTEKEIKITQQIHFDFNKDTIRPESFPILDAIVDVLKQHTKMKIEIQGHTDNVGQAAYNEKLSDRRAASVRKYLIAHGIAEPRLTSKGYGMKQPIVPNNSPQNRALNRRVQFVRTEGAP
jgi:outer membrane protein OmpA-like peptidoglycan-associated protein